MSVNCVNWNCFSMDFILWDAWYAANCIPNLLIVTRFVTHLIDSSPKMILIGKINIYDENSNS